ncbi:MAG: restriction endonuclease subunit S [Gemmatimonadota bacterium]|uniref:restriction endonuclease subunit S n=1 Tax=Candidatus Palauibacter scopulicola TaxID=3056741 RepID=UPI00142B5ADB|nr:restriction endonuclease subunit S [Candidatus Palauibacter scopulicola]MDE2664504.1 restriction endonuclease subunit S [Candidatus Palauibacter scopulicola]MYA41766.1 hypothetical protein [Gemmatimonadota bacterium]MYE95438.1 hypothetical protein [Gemmatimonadota bacterium]MYJ11155.1 hypothetical protein [Gemmatimonadota bacterium]
MTDGLKDAHREAIIAALAANDRVERAVLFGSRATGTNTMTSDVDIALFGDRLTLTDQARLSAALDEIPMAQVVDLLLYDAIQDQVLRDHIRRDGIEWLALQREVERDRRVLVEGDDRVNRCRWRLAPLGELVGVHREQINPSSSPDSKFSHHSIPAFDEARSPAVESGSAIKSNKFTVPPDAVLVSRLNPRFPRVWTPDVGGDFPAICSTEFLVLRPHSMDRRFLHHLCMGPRFRTSLLERVTGTSGSHQRVSPAAALEIKIPVPPIPEQRAIADVLGTLDDKIELNRRMNEMLEGVARALFKSWFVDFDPVRAKMQGRDTGLPPDIADLFPDRMVESEMGEIPEGWEATTLATVIELHDRKRIPLNKRQRSQRQGPYPYYGAAGIMDFVDDYLFDGVHILMGEDGSVVDAHGHPVVQYVWGKFWVNNHAHVIKGTAAISDEHVYLLLKHSNITAFVTGAVQPKLNQRNLKSIPLVVPAEPACRVFSRLVAPLFARLRLNSDECSLLVTLRDKLLPKLISGEIRVPDAESALRLVT